MNIITKQHKLKLVLLFLCSLLFTNKQNVFGQYNLVPNNSFETYMNCPSSITLEAYLNSKPDIWYKPDKRGAAYYNACANGQNNNYDGVPVNFGGGGYNFQPARTGNGYVIMFFYNGMNARNYLQVELLDSLKQGRCYYAEYYVNKQNSINLACNNQSMLFTNTPVYVDTAASPTVYLLPANPQIQNPYIITDTLNWVKVGGVFTAQGGEKYLTLGNFKNNAQTQTKQVQTTGYNGAAYYIEDVSVIPLDSMPLAADAGADRTIVLGDSTFIGSYLTGLTGVTWYNSAGIPVNTNVSGFYVKPLFSTYYVIEQTVCGYTSRDTVNITVNMPVPLKFLSFTANRTNGINNLTWKTANESNIKNYEVQRSTNAQEFTTIASVAAKNGEAQTYTYNDKIDFSGKLYYRIKINENDGKVEYSKIVTLNNNYQQPTINIYPNPAKHNITIQLKENSLINTEAVIVNAQGKQVLKTVIKSTNQLINISTLSQGTYFIKFENGAVEKIVK